MKKKYFIPVLLLSFVFLFCACNKTAEFKNTKINGQTLAGLDTVQATQKVKDILTEQQNKIDIKLVHGDKTFTLKGADFDTDIASLSNQTIQQAKPTFLQKLGSLAGRQNNITVPNSKIVGNLDQKIDQIASQIDCEPSGLDVIFSQNDEKPFQITEAVDGQIVNKSLLKQQILENLEKQSSNRSKSKSNFSRRIGTKLAKTQHFFNKLLFVSRRQKIQCSTCTFRFQRTQS